MRLRDALASLSAADLRAIVQMHGLPMGANPLRQDVINMLAHHLASGHIIEASLNGLSKDARQGLDALLSQGGAMPARLFERDYGYLQLQTPYPLEAFPRRPITMTATTSLYYAGLIYRVYGKLGDWEGEVFTIPEEVIAHLPTVSKPSFTDLLDPAPDPAQREAQGDLMRDIGLFLCYLQRETVRAVRGDQLSKRDIVRLNAELSLQEDLSDVRTETDTRWLVFVHHMAVMLGLAKLQGGMLRPSEKAENWLAQPLERQIREAWSSFLKDAGWSEIAQSIAPGYTYDYSSPRNVLNARQRILEALKRCAPQRWYTIASLSRAIKEHDAFFLRARGGSIASLYWDSSAFYGSWESVENPLIVHVLCRSLAAFAIVETGGPAGHEEPAVFRLTQRGALLIGLSKGAIESPTGAPIVVQPNYEIIVPREAAPRTLYYLQQVADLQKADRASIYLLTQTSIWRYLQAGGDIARTISFLEKASQRPLPQNVAYSLNEWAARHGEITVEAVMLLRTATDSLLAELRANKKIALPVQEVLSGRAVTLRDSDYAGLIELMKKAGYWPKTGQGVPTQASAKQAGQATVTIAANDLVHLLTGALVLAHIQEEVGWRSPISDALIRSLLPRLSPPQAKLAQRAASDAIVRYEQMLGDPDWDDDADADTDVIVDPAQDDVPPQ